MYDQQHLDFIVKQWYMINGYMNNETNWFCSTVTSNYKSKTVHIHDCTNKAQNKTYEFKDTTLEGVFKKAIKYFQDEALLSPEDLRIIENQIDEALKEI